MDIAEVLREHTWWLAGNLGVPGMPDRTTYKCACGWNGDDPHDHVAYELTEYLGLLEFQDVDICWYMTRLFAVTERA